MTYEEINFKKPIEMDDYRECSDFVIQNMKESFTMQFRKKKIKL